MADVTISNVDLFMRKRPEWDPVPWWIKLNKEQVTKFNEIQVRLNTKIAQLEAEKIVELSKVAGISLQ